MLQTISMYKFAIDDGMYLLNSSSKNIKSILLYFPDYQFMHFGDHLFFEPLARELQVKGYEVIIFPIKAMEFYFKKLNFIIGNENSLETVDLVLSKTEFITHLSGINNQILFVDTTKSNTKLPLCTRLNDNVFKFLQEDSSDCVDVPSYIDVNHTSIGSTLNSNNQYIIFNNYLDSGSFRSGKRHQQIIVDFVRKLKLETGCKIFHTGSKKDKDNDCNKYDFIDIDLRGKTSIEDMFYLISHDNVIYNVSFDAFQMHLFFIKNKKSFILFRGRYLKKNVAYQRDYVLPPFLFNRIKTDLIEYIE